MWFPDDVKARPRELSVVTRIIVHEYWCTLIQWLIDSCLTCWKCQTKLWREAGFLVVAEVFDDIWVVGLLHTFPLLSETISSCLTSLVFVASYHARCRRRDVATPSPSGFHCNQPPEYWRENHNFWVWEEMPNSTSRTVDCRSRCLDGSPVIRIWS